MKANKYIIFTILAFSILMTSCESWLDVNPKSEVKAEDLFESESGFREALFGVYTQMSSSEIYGGNLTMSFLDVLAQNYVITQEGQMFYYESKYDYTNSKVENRINDIWAKMYYCIVNCNNILDNIKGKEDLFKDNNYDVLVAETKALRAFLHFDILRMFAPSVVSGADKKAIPYVDKVSKTPFPQLTVNQVLDRVIDELLSARSLLADIDPIGPAFDEYKEKWYYSTDEYINDAGFLLYRKSRMNYYSVTGLLARVSLYKGDKENALAYAKEVIDSDRFQAITENKLIGTDVPDIIFSEEIVFRLFNDNLKEKSDFIFKGEDGLIISEERKEAYYEKEAYGTTDYRDKYQFDVAEGDITEIVSKYNYNKDYRSNRARYIPIIRLSEMYYIAAESTTNNDNALAYINAVRLNRGLPELVDSPDLEDELYKEYRKEFIAEGQLFYYLKRKNIVDIEYSPTDGSDAVYVFPLPDTEIEFGNIN